LHASGLKKTCLHNLHLEMGAKMAGFAGYDMPLSYPAGALREHLACRERAALFDVSHMGQIDICTDTGDTAPVLAALETLCPSNLIDLPAGQQRYSLFLNERGGIRDDLMVMHFPDRVRLVVNAACADSDFEWLQQHLSGFAMHRQQRALLALQGPQAAGVLAGLVPQCHDMLFMQIADISSAGTDIQLSRSGYTGEDGFEISLPENRAADFARQLCADSRTAFAGLIARDSLRLEAGLCLYGQDMDEDITVLSAGLGWAVPKIRRAGGRRAGGFIGDAVTLGEFASGSAWCRVGVLAPKGVPPRSGMPVFNADEGGDEIGVVTSGSPAPTVGRPVAMLRIGQAFEAAKTPLFAEVRSRRLPLERVPMPFAPHRFYKAPAR